MLAVADTIFNRYGIHSVDDLIAWCGADPDSVRFLDNSYYRFVDYHCLKGCHYLSDLETDLYPVLSGDNYISFTIDTDYKINYDSDNDTYICFHIPASNTPAKNGVVHAIDDILPLTELEPTSILFETTDFFDIKHSDYYLKHYKRFFDGQNTFEKIKWDGDYLLYYLKDEGENWNMKNDCLSMQGWWWISVTFPKVMKGNYEVYVYQPSWSLPDCVVTLDGEPTGYIYRQIGSGYQKVADAYFPTVSEHTITLRNIRVGFLFWDYVEFVPVN